MSDQRSPGWTPSAGRGATATGEGFKDEEVGGPVFGASPGDDTVPMPDSLGENVPMDPPHAGPVAGNTTGAEGMYGRHTPDVLGRGEVPPEPEEDLGPGDSAVQTIGGEGAR